jgi:hypothetical protein
MAAGRIGLVGIVSLLALSFCASTASAEDLEMTFTEARANVGVQLSNAALFEIPATAPFNAQIDPGSGAITAGLLTVPAFSTHIVDPIDAYVTVDFQIGMITGGFDEATGVLTGSGTAGGTLTAADGVDEGECLVTTTPSPLTLSTTGNSGGATPRFGVLFTAGLIGAGAVAGQWTDMHATATSPEHTTFCSNVDARIGGSGGIWLEHQGDIAPPAPPQLTSTDPASPSESGTPRIFGVAEAGSTVKVYAGSVCGGVPVATRSAAELGSPGIPVDVAEGVTATFSARAIDAVGNTSACSAPISYTHEKRSTGGNVVPPPADPKCVVPKLAGKTLKQAKRALKAAHCKPGKVSKPKQPKGKKRRVLVVKSSSPRRGAKPADRKVDLKLHAKPKPKPKKPRRS